MKKISSKRMRRISCNYHSLYNIEFIRFMLRSIGRIWFKIRVSISIAQHCIVAKTLWHVLCKAISKQDILLPFSIHHSYQQNSGACL